MGLIPVQKQLDTVPTHTMFPLLTLGGTWVAEYLSCLRIFWFKIPKFNKRRGLEILDCDYCQMLIFRQLEPDSE